MNGYPENYDFKSFQKLIAFVADYVEPEIEETEDEDGDIEEEVIEDGYWYVDSIGGLGQYQIYDEDGYFQIYLVERDTEKWLDTITFGRFATEDKFTIHNQDLFNDFMATLTD